MDYQKIYELKKAKKILKKHNILDTNQEIKIEEEELKEKNKKDEE